MSVFEQLCKENEEWVKVRGCVDDLKKRINNLEVTIRTSNDVEQRVRLERKVNGLRLSLNNAYTKLSVIEDEILVNYTNTYNKKALGYDCGITSDEYYERVFEQNGLFNGIKF